MGMFDTVHVKCPLCGGLIEIQSKAGECNLLHFRYDSVPVAVADDIDGDSLSCKKCCTEFTVHANTPKRVDMLTKISRDIKEPEEKEWD